MHSCFVIKILVIIFYQFWVNVQCCFQFTIRLRRFGHIVNFFSLQRHISCSSFFIIAVDLHGHSVELCASHRFWSRPKGSHILSSVIFFFLKERVNGLNKDGNQKRVLRKKKWEHPKKFLFLLKSFVKSISPHSLSLSWEVTAFFTDGHMTPKKVTSPNK